MLLLSPCSRKQPGHLGLFSAHHMPAARRPAMMRAEASRLLRSRGSQSPFIPLRYETPNDFCSEILFLRNEEKCCIFPSGFPLSLAS